MLEIIKNLSLEELKDLKKEVEQLIALKNSNITPKKVIFEIAKTDSRHKSWAKVVRKVDITKQDGYAFVGNFITAGRHEAEIGSIIMHRYGVGSVKNHRVYIDVYRLTETGLKKLDLSLDLYNRDMTGWALLLRDDLAKIVNGGAE
jgi:hypothetical protein